jgi:hypothetical protein
MNSTDFPKPYPSQYDLRGESITCYGSDFRNCINYTFNNQGYRSEFEFDLEDRDELLVCLGSSIATGHGLELNQSFSSIIAHNFNKKLWNLGQGCFRSSNQTMLEQIEFLINTDLKIDYYVIQFTHINRMGNKSTSHIELDQTKCIENFINILDKISTMLNGKKWCWLLLDWSCADFPEWVVNHPNKIVIDPEGIDHIDVDQYQDLAPSTTALRLLSLHPGAEWNKHIANLVIEYFNAH